VIATKFAKKLSIGNLFHGSWLCGPHQMYSFNIAKDNIGEGYTLVIKSDGVLRAQEIDNGDDATTIVRECANFDHLKRLIGEALNLIHPDQLTIDYFMIETLFPGDEKNE
jgi:hypothetical protein